MTGRDGLVQVVERNLGSPPIATRFRPPAGVEGTDSHDHMDPPKEALAPEG